MKKLIVTSLLLCFSAVSFSQKVVSTKKFPYQVLFVESASIFGKEVKQYDYLTNDDLLNVEGSITLFHYTGEIFELKEGSYWASDLVKKKPKRSDRLILDPKGEYAAYPKQPYSRGCDPGYDDQIQLIIPDNIYELKRTREQNVGLCWALGKNLKYKDEYIFEIEFRNIYDDVIAIVNTTEDFYEFIPNRLDTIRNDTVNLDDGFLLFSISVKNHPDLKTEDIGIRLVNVDEIIESKETDNYYTTLLDAIYFDFFNENRKAKALYQYQLRKSNQDPRFIKLYEDFLDRNPEFK